IPKLFLGFQPTYFRIEIEPGPSHCFARLIYLGAIGTGGGADACRDWANLVQTRATGLQRPETLWAPSAPLTAMSTLS
ncbi:MAG: hypothetical protein VB959_04645, partial [Rhodospirillales bacterium]